ncbi:MAG: TIGR02266 family protein [Proteobacteria bacterium]|nr:TIGR02266 family protein [Pseudomonadota bacterium]
MSSGSHEQRATPRTPIELKVEYKRLNTFFYDYTRNISRGGTFIKTARPLAAGTQFIFTLVVPQLGPPLSLRGRVKWVVTEDQANRDPVRPDAGMGIEFIYEDDAERERVAGAVEALMIRHLGDRAAMALLHPV